MAILIFALGAIMILAGFGLLWGSLNLVPTEMGLLYGVCGVVLLGCGAIVLAIGALITRLTRLLMRERTFPTVKTPPVERSPEEAVHAAPLSYEAPEPVVEKLDVSPSLAMSAAEAQTNHPTAAPYIIGRYAAGGANYAIFSDGTIEAETEEGAVRFGTMSEFRAYIADRKR